MGTLCSELFLADLIWALLFTLWWWEVDSRRSLGPTPSSLANEEAGAYSSCVYFAALFVHNGLLSLDHRTRLAFIVDTNNLRPQLEFSAFRGRREWFQELDQTLTVDDALCIEFRNTRDWVARLGGIEVNHFLRGFLEGWCMLVQV